MVLTEVTDQELQVALELAQNKLEAVKPYNGTAPGARAVAQARNEIDTLMREVGRRMTAVRNAR